MANTTYLITGGLGHIGSYITEHLCRTKEDIRIIIIDNEYNGKMSNIDEAKKWANRMDNEIIVEKGDIGNSYWMSSYFHKYRPNYVFHQASMLTLDTKKDRRRSFDTNVQGFVNVLEMCLKYGVEKLVYASSASVFGNPEFLPVSEIHHFNNCTLLYGAHKVCNEFLARSYAKEEGLKFVGLRYFNVYGHRQPLNNVYTQVVPKWIESFLNKKDITIYDKGLQTMDMIHGSDVGYLNIRAMENDIYCGKMIDGSEFGGFINIGSGVETSVIGLYGIIKNELEKQGIDVSGSKLNFENHDPNQVKRRRCNTRLMEKLLTPMPKLITTTEGIRLTVNQKIKELST